MPVIDASSFDPFIPNKYARATLTYLFVATTMRKPMDINENAPVVLHHEIEIFAPPEKVWDRLSRIELWDEWRHDVSGSQHVSGTGEGAVFRWRHRKLFRTTATVQSWKSMRELGWTAEPPGGTFRQVVRLSGDFRKTTVTATASMEGRIVGNPILRSLFENQINRTNEIWFGALKTRLEYGKGESPEPPPDERPVRRMRPPM